jgi:tRNA pseudouridine55 synthase
MGVLPIFLGQATRLSEYFLDSPKVYCARVVLGVTTDTYDGEGTVVARGDISSLTLEAIQKALEAFRGEIEQVPPMHSALKQRGQRLYTLARAGLMVERQARRVRIYDLQVLGWEPPALILWVECGKGTYMRSLAHDLGQKLGCGAYQDKLVRVQDGIFGIEDSLSLEELELAVTYGYWQDLTFPMDEILLEWQAVILGKAREQMALRGQEFPLHTGPTVGGSGQRVRSQPGGLCRVYSRGGDLLAVARLDPQTGLCRPEKVFTPWARAENNHATHG